MSKPPLYIGGYIGLGDTIFFRPFIRSATTRYKVWLATAWPELFTDLPVKFSKPRENRRTQNKNIQRQPSRIWCSPPTRSRSHSRSRVKLMYNGDTIKQHGSIIKAIEHSLPLADGNFVFDLPDMGPSPVSVDKPIALVRPVTARREWFNPARNPDPTYIYEVAAALMTTHHVVAVADIEEGEEWIVGKPPPCHQSFYGGELTVKPLLALLQHADVCVGGVGWIVPASIALKVPNVFIIGGGQGAYNSPEVVTDPRMNLSGIQFCMPTNYCRCNEREHDCDKRIEGFIDQWNAFYQARTLRCSIKSPRAA